MNKTDLEKQELLKHFWNKRNPSHDYDSNGIDRFWGTALMVIEEYQEALTLGIVVKPFYCLGDPKFGGVKRCSKQCKGCELSNEQ